MKNGWYVCKLSMDLARKYFSKSAIMANMKQNKDKGIHDEGLALQEAKPRLKRPPLYKVLLLNDDYTPMDFVIDVLLKIFGMNREQASSLTKGEFMLSKDLEFTLNAAFREARDKNHEFMTVEHLLLALLDNSSASSVLRACGADIDNLKRDITGFLDETTPLLHDDEGETQPTLGFQRVLQRAVFHVQSTGTREVGAPNVLVA